MKASFCSPVLCVLVLNMPFMAWANVLRTQYLIPKGMDRAYVLSVVVGAAVNVAANVALIPRLGALGAAWGTTLAEVAVCVVQVVEVRGMLPPAALARGEPALRRRRRRDVRRGALARLSHGLACRDARGPGSRRRDAFRPALLGVACGQR